MTGRNKWPPPRKKRSFLSRFLGRGWRWRLKAFKVGYAEGYEAALDTIDAVDSQAYNFGYERGYQEGKEYGIRTRAHYTQLMGGDEE